jgi:hypothetical protein
MNRHASGCTPAPALEQPLLASSSAVAGKGEAKRRVPWGYLPVWSEFVPLDKAKGGIDWPGVIVNVGSGLIMGCRESLGGIVSASLVFSSSDRSAVNSMVPWGIAMMLYTQSMSVLWYAIFGRLQYAYSTQQDLICILQAEMASHIAILLRHNETKIHSTIMAMIGLTTMLSGISCVLLGKLGLGSYMFLFPTTVINGFLGSIGVVVVRAAMQTASGVKFEYFYPTDLRVFLKRNRLAQVCCMCGMVCCIRLGPVYLNRWFPKSKNIHRMGGLVCQLIPLALFLRGCIFLWRASVEARGAWLDVS